MATFANPNNYFQAVAAIIGAAWPEVVANGIYLPGELGMINWDDKAGNGDLPLVLMTSHFQPDRSGQWGITNYVWMDTMVIAWVHHREWDFSVLGAKLVTLMDKLVETPLASGERVRTPYPVYDMDVPINGYFVQTGRGFWGVGVAFESIFGVTS